MVPTRKSLASESFSSRRPCRRQVVNRFWNDRVAYFVTSCVILSRSAIGPPPNVTQASPARSLYLRCVAIVLEFTATFDVTSSQTVAAYL